ncbi:Alpha amylase, catalytic domain [Caprobacter fermentans]|uniref:Alpha amylase, catalytic domain n=4 Tax=Caproicibacter fermentans TaxID=2576756 RepID=A0A6N8HYY0_9FIRM|nr:Alpha amylase, catalytic domain [Caproicibacter fermentans]
MCGVTERDGCYLLNFFSSQPSLNYGFNRITAPWQKHYTSPDCVATREEMKDVMRFWLDAGCDGFRVDMAASLVKNDDDHAATAEIWRNVREMLDREYPEAAMVSEWSDPDKAINKSRFHMDFYLNHRGNGYDSLFRKTGSDGAPLSFFSKQGRGNIMEFLEDYLPKYNVSKSAGYISFITCNHDTPRMTLGYDNSECKIAYSFLLTMPGVPFLYYGDEIGMQYFNLTSVEGGYHRTGTRTPMQWTNGKNLGFSNAEREKLYLPVDARDCAPTVENEEKDENSLLNTVRKVLALRHQITDLQAVPNFEVIYAEKDCYPFVYRRGKYFIAVNPSCREVEIPLTEKGKPVFTIGRSTLENGRLRMRGQSFAMFQSIRS